MEKEERYMETLNATVVEDDNKYFIRISTGMDSINIPLSDDKPNEVKLAFNKMILRLKKGPFEIKLDEVRQDLFSQVANEYIQQLNRELKEVFGEMESHNFIEEENDSGQVSIN